MINSLGFFFFQAEDGIRDGTVTGVQTCALPISRKVLFIARKNGRPFAQSIDLEGMRVAREPKFLSENLNMVPASGKGARYVFIFPRADAAKVEFIVEYLRKHLGQDGPVGIDSDLK